MGVVVHGIFMSRVIHTSENLFSIKIRRIQMDINVISRIIIIIIIILGLRTCFSLLSCLRFSLPLLSFSLTFPWKCVAVLVAVESSVITDIFAKHLVIIAARFRLWSWHCHVDEENDCQDLVEHLVSCSEYLLLGALTSYNCLPVKQPPQNLYTDA